MENNSNSKGLIVNHNKNGFVSIFLHYSAHPEKRSNEFKANARKGFGSLAAYKREYELDFSSLEGSKIFNEFLREQIQPIQILSNKPLCRSFDWGFLHPALVSQFNEHDQWLWHRCFLGEEMLVYTFLEVSKWLCGEIADGVLTEPALNYINSHHMYKWIEYPSQHHFRNFCDTTGTARADKVNESNITIAQQPPFNLRMEHKKTDPEMGFNLMSLRMRKRVDGKYGVLVSDHPSCMLLIQAMTGGFVRDEHGRIPDTIFTHPMDALRYILVNVSNERMEQNILKCCSENWSQFIKSRPKNTIQVHHSRKIYT